jgi:hypothetical protein
MNAIRLRRWVSRRRGHVALIAVVLALGGAVAVHHGQDAHVVLQHGVVAMACLGLVVVAAGLTPARFPSPRVRVEALLLPKSISAKATADPAARDGPALQVFRF